MESRTENAVEIFNIDRRPQRGFMTWTTWTFITTLNLSVVNDTFTLYFLLQCRF